MDILMSIAIVCIVTLLLFGTSMFILNRLISSEFYEWIERSNSDYKFIFQTFKWPIILLIIYLVATKIHHELSFAVSIGLLPVVLGDINRGSFYKTDKKLQTKLTELMPYNKQIEFLKGFNKKPELFFANDQFLFIVKRDRIDTLKWNEVKNIESCHKGWTIVRITSSSGMVIHFNDEIDNFAEIMMVISTNFSLIDENWKGKVRKLQGKWMSLI